MSLADLEHAILAALGRGTDMEVSWQTMDGLEMAEQERRHREVQAFAAGGVAPSRPRDVMEDLRYWCRGHGVAMSRDARSGSVRFEEAKGVSQ